MRSVLRFEIPGNRNSHNFLSSGDALRGGIDILQMKGIHPDILGIDISSGPECLYPDILGRDLASGECLGASTQRILTCLTRNVLRRGDDLERENHENVDHSGRSGNAEVAHGCPATPGAYAVSPAKDFDAP